MGVLNLITMSLLIKEIFEGKPVEGMAIKASFQPVGELYYDYSTWKVLIQHDLMNFTDIMGKIKTHCHTTQEQIQELMNHMHDLHIFRADEKFVPLPHPYIYVEAVRQCHLQGPDCHIANFNTYSKFKDTLDSIVDTNFEEIFANMYVERGRLRQHDTTGRGEGYINSFLRNKTVSIQACNKPFQLWRVDGDVHCFAPVPKSFLSNKDRYTYGNAEITCKKLKARLWEPSFQFRGKLEHFYAHHLQNTSTFYVKGLYNKHSFIRNIDHCQTSDTDRNGTFHAKYNLKANCVSYVDEGDEVDGALCHQDGEIKMLFSDPRLSQIFRLKFANTKGAMRYNLRDDLYTLYDEYYPSHVVCHCRERDYKTHFNINYKEILHNILQTTSDKIHRQCEILLTLIKDIAALVLSLGGAGDQNTVRESPGLWNVTIPLHRPKRDIGSFLKAIARQFSLNPLYKFRKLIKQQVERASNNTDGETTTTQVRDILQRSNLLPRNASLTNNSKGSGSHLNETAGPHDNVLQDRQKRQIHFNTHVETFNEVLQAKAAAFALVTKVRKVAQDFQDKFTEMQQKVNANMEVLMTIVSEQHNTLTMMDIVKRIEDTLPQNYSLPYGTYNQIFEHIQLKHKIFEHKVIFLVKLPIVNMQHKLKLFRATPLPYADPRGNPILPNFEASFLGVAPNCDKYAVIKSHDLMTCRKFGNFYCHDIELLEQSVNSCMWAHFQNNTNRADICKFQNLARDNYFAMDYEHKVHYSVNKNMQAVMACSNATQHSNTIYTAVTLSGIGEIKIGPHCEIEMEGYYAANP